MEKLIETLMYRSRWVLAPIYLGLSVAVFALGVKFFQELIHLMVLLFWGDAQGVTLNEAGLILIVLSLIDLAMVGGLLVMVMMSGYENFVSQLDISEGEEKLSWLGKMDSGSLKAKIAASIVAISSIHLLKKFMEIESIMRDYENGNYVIMWYVVMHITFVASALFMGILDNKTRHQTTPPASKD